MFLSAFFEVIYKIFPILYLIIPSLDCQINFKIFLKLFLERLILKGKGEHKLVLIDLNLLAVLKLQIYFTDYEIFEVESDLELENHEGQ
jgi:hypothetical protein